MIIEDEIFALFEEGNPVPDLDGLDPVPFNAAGYLETIERRSTEMTQTNSNPTIEDSKSKPNRLMMAAAVTILVLGAAVVFQTQTGNEAPVATNAPVVTGEGPLSGTSVPEVATTAPDVATTIPVTTTSSQVRGPLGLEIVGIDGSTSNLGLPADAWMADLTADGRHVAFLTESLSVGFCGLCGKPVYLAIVEVGSSEGTFVYFNNGVIDENGPIAQPAWSPDGMYLAFQARSISEGGGNLDIYVADFSATSLHTESAADAIFEVPVIRLTTDDAIDEFPAWSPDGTVIYYDNRGDGPAESDITLTSEIWSVPATGGTPTRLTNNDVADMQPDAGPDGRVAYWHEGEIWVMEPDGASQSRLSIVPGGLGWNPRWSPDGTKLALLQYNVQSPQAIFGANSIHGTLYPQMDVVVVDVTNGSVTTLDVQVASFFNPVSWLPDGSGLLVVRYR